MASHASQVAEGAQGVPSAQAAATKCLGWTCGWNNRNLSPPRPGSCKSEVGVPAGWVLGRLLCLERRQLPTPDVSSLVCVLISYSSGDISQIGSEPTPSSSF